MKQRQPEFWWLQRRRTGVGAAACGDETKRRGRTRVTPGCARLQEGAAVVDDAGKKGREWNEDAALEREER
jgi:hypothetical protein